MVKNNKAKNRPREKLTPKAEKLFRELVLSNSQIIRALSSFLRNVRFQESQTTCVIKFNYASGIGGILCTHYYAARKC